jgi:small subunit ribosomal protein S20
MPQHKSAAKRMKTSAVRRNRNKPRLAKVRKTVKAVRGSTDRDQAAGALAEAVSELDRAASKGVIHRNKASRLKSRLTKTTNAMGS